MLDRIMYISPKEVMLIYTDREAMVLYDCNGHVLFLLDEMLAPLESNCSTYSEYVRSLEVTQDINLKLVE